MKIGYIFAGQGSQKPEMGKEFYDSFDVSKSVYDRSNLALGMDLKDICFNGTLEDLSMTEVTQPAILTTSIAMLKAFESQINIKPHAVAGLSLGEYTAHVCSGSIQFEDAVKLVRQRGAFMQEAVPVGYGGMRAITGLNPDLLNELIEEASAYGIIEISNINSPKQVVIGGEIGALEKASELALDKGAKRVVPLSVSAPFHTSMLKKAEVQLEAALENVQISQMDCPVVANINGRIIASESLIPEYLAKQVTSTVQWTKCIESMKSMGIDTLIEFGPGTALSGFVAKIDRSIKVLSINDMESLNKTIQFIREAEELDQAI